MILQAYFKIRKVERLLEIDLDGNVHEHPYSTSLENDLRMMWDKDFWQKWSQKLLGQPFEKAFKDRGFGGQEGRAIYDGEFRARGVYRIAFEDGSVAEVLYLLDDYTGHVDVETVSGGDGTDATRFRETSETLPWTTEELDQLAEKTAA